MEKLYQGDKGDSEKGSSKTEDKTKKNDDAKHGQIKKLSQNRTSSLFHNLIGLMLVLDYSQATSESST